MTTATRVVLAEAAAPMPVPARVLYVIDEYSTAAAGTERQLLQLVNGLDRSRYEPHLAVFRDTPFLRGGSVFRCPVHVLDIASLRTPAALVRLARLARLVARLDIELAHVFFNDASIAAPFFCRLGGARVIAARRDMGFWYTPSILRALRLSNRFVDMVVANSDAVRRNVHDCEGVPLDQITLIGNGHDPRRFEDPPAAGFRERLGIAPEDRVIGMVANLYPRKRQADLIRALPAISSSGRRVHAVLVGAGPDERPLLDLAASLGLAGSVHVVRGVSDVAPVIKHFDVAVLCSESEGFSNAILEYAFCGRPIVCTNVGGNPEFIKPGETGLHVACGDILGLAAAISELLASPSLGRRLGEHARQAALDGYTSATMLDAHMDLYDRARRMPAFALAR
jgi:glycosyltransferase involved in cell wall biosynthesis